MADKKTKPADAVELRRQAEALAAANEARRPAALSPEEIARILHELRVHQIELEMQNEELRRTQWELEAARERYFDLYDFAPVGYVTISEKGMILEANLTAATLLCATRDALAGQPFSRFILKEDQDSYYQHRRALFETGAPQAFSLRMTKKDRTHFWAYMQAGTALDEDGATLCRAVLSDVTEHKQVEDFQAFLAQTHGGGRGESFFDALARHLAQSLGMDFICIDRLEGDGLTARTVSVWCDGKFEDNVTYALKDTPCGDVVGKDVCCFPASVCQYFPHDQVLQELRAESYVGVTLWSHTHQPIGLIAVIGRGPLANRPLAETLLKLVGVRAAGELERLDAEEALKESEQQHRLLVENSHDIIFTVNADGVFTFASASWTEILGHHPSQVIGKSFRAFVHPDDIAACAAFLRRVIDTGERQAGIEYRARHLDGTWHWHTTSAVPLRDAAGTVTGFEGISKDITRSKEAETALRASEQKLELALRSARMGVWSWDLAENRRSFDDQVCALLGLDPAAFTGKPEEFFSTVHPDDRETLMTASARTLEQGALYAPEYRAVWPDGSIHHINARARLTRDAAGRPLRIDGIIWDVTEHKQAEAERTKLEEQLQQARKMESVGRLAGGVAHDFNNMLAVILGYADMALGQLDQDETLHADLLEIRTAATRSADLTRQLLAFARRQTVAPKVLDLNEMVSGMLKMLQRLIGENIALEWIPGAALWPVKMDPSQIDQILANLCINARDAIDGTGTLRIETENCTIDEAHRAAPDDAAPGEYVLITVSDNGGGMDRETLAQVFEPFFTTKGVGEGTGMGLATVFGIVKQNGGFITVRSELGQGTDFEIYLPRHAGTAEPARADCTRETPVGNGETILLAEDEPAILKMAASMLKILGYAVLAADTPGNALRMAREHTGALSLLLTDVVMPEMNGRDLAKDVQALHPGSKLLFMSGYTADVIAHQGVLGMGTHFIQKPFTIEALAAKVQEVLGEGRG